jgi:hypothetical protein
VVSFVRVGSAKNQLTSVAEAAVSRSTVFVETAIRFPIALPSTAPPVVMSKPSYTWS